MEGKRIELPHDFCLKDCQHNKPRIETVSLYAGGELYDQIITLHCEHEDVCAMWSGMGPIADKQIKACWTCKHDEGSAPDKPCCECGQAYENNKWEPKK